MTDLRDRVEVALRDRYRIERELGHGGMGRVFLAEDLKHHRKVALKVLRPEIAQSLGTDRFLREIRISAQLNHPNILTLIDSGDADGLMYYVMPFVEGESLRDRLTREAQLPLEDALQITREVADALSYAHGLGVIHRDIKPENILSEEGHAVVADFGIARRISEAGGERLTESGLAVGTPAYMSPEQASGAGLIDGRTDIYSLACVLYEMLAGGPPYVGPTPQAILARKAADPMPGLRVIRDTVPLAVEGAIAKALARTPADRFATPRQFVAALAAAGSTAVTVRAGRPRATVLAMALVGGLIVTATYAAWRRDRDTEFVVGSTRQVTSAPGLEIEPAISPDGKMVAYAAGTPGQTQIFVRPVAGGRAVMVTDPGEPCVRPRWSPDGARITYLSPSGMYSASVLGGERVLILPQRLGGHGSLSPTGDRLAFVTYAEKSIYIANEDGTNAKKIATSPAQEVHSLAWSPDGRFLAFVTGNPTFLGGSAIGNLAASTIWIVATSGGAPVRISDDTHLNTSPVWTPDGSHVLFVSTLRGGRDVYSQRVGSRGEARGAPQRLTTGSHAHTISVNSDGSLLGYATLATTSNIWTLPIPRLGETTAASMRAVTIGNQTIETVSISPDRKWLAFDSNVRGNADIYKVPVDGGEPHQLTRDPTDDFQPAWSPDGAEIAFHSFRKGNRDLYVMLADGSRVLEVVATPAQEQVARWSADGTTLSYHGGDGIYLIRRSGGPGSDWGRSRRVLTDSTASHPSRHGGAHPSWSPVADSFAFATPEGLLLMSPDGEAARVVSRGVWAADIGLDWSVDGRTLYYIALGYSGTWGIWSVPVSGGVARRLVHFTDPTRQPYRPRLANDGNSFYFVIGSRESDIWVMDLAKK